MTIEIFSYWDFCKYMRTRRIKKNLTQQMLADIVGIKRGQYKAKECGEKIDLVLLNQITSKVYEESPTVFLSKFDIYLSESKMEQNKMASRMPK